eukprot:1499683-Pyramimonas_sp.AAC.1
MGSQRVDIFFYIQTWGMEAHAEFDTTLCIQRGPQKIAQSSARLHTRLRARAPAGKRRMGFDIHRGPDSASHPPNTSIS